MNPPQKNSKKASTPLHFEKNWRLATGCGSERLGPHAPNPPTRIENPITSEQIAIDQTNQEFNTLLITWSSRHKFPFKRCLLSQLRWGFTVPHSLPYGWNGCTRMNARSLKGNGQRIFFREIMWVQNWPWCPEHTNKTFVSVLRKCQLNGNTRSVLSTQSFFETTDCNFRFSVALESVHCYWSKNLSQESFLAFWQTYIRWKSTCTSTSSGSNCFANRQDKRNISWSWQQGEYLENTQQLVHQQEHQLAWIHSETHHPASGGSVMRVSNWQDPTCPFQTWITGTKFWTRGFTTSRGGHTGHALIIDARQFLTRPNI